jgi:site-specific recombinase XerD
MLPPILAGSFTPDTKRRVEQFFFPVASCFEAWVTRRQSPHTQRAYREDFMAFVKFLGIQWPMEAWQILKASIKDVQAFRDQLIAKDAAAKTLNRRISSVSSFYKYLGAAAAEMRLPITVPNPAHAQFIARESTDPREETKALSATRARQLMGMPSGDTVLDFRDRAILRVFLYSGARLSTTCRLKVSDFHQDRDEATIRLHEKGDKRRTIGLHYQAAQAIREYIEKVGITSGPLFRPRLNPPSRKLAERAMNPVSMYLLIQSYLVRLPPAPSRSTRIQTAVRSAPAFIPPTPYVPRPRRCFSTPVLTSERCRTFLAIGTSPPRRPTTSAGEAPRRVPHTTCPFKGLSPPLLLYTVPCIYS